MNVMMILQIVLPQLRMISTLLANKDANDTGADDKAAKFLRWAAVAAEAIVADRAVPPPPAGLIEAPKPV